MPNRIIVPKFEPEIIQLKADKERGGDTEKIATTSIKELVINGVRITSRYDQADELVLMAAVISEMPRQARLKIKSVWCDSKACKIYHLATTSITAARYFSHGMIKHDGGYNGIYADNGEIDFDPWWREDPS